MFEEHYFDCCCSDFGHVIRFSFDAEDGDLYLSVHLHQWEPWYKRVWAAIRYVFKKDKTYGHYDTTMLRPEDFGRLHSLLDRAEAFNRAETAKRALAARQEKPLLKG